MRVKIKEIAARAGYAPATVSRLLNNDPGLSITNATRQKILAAAQELGYWRDKPNPKLAAQVALLVQISPKDHLEDRYFKALQAAVEEGFAGTGIELTPFHAVNDLLAVAKDFQGFVAIGTDGLTSADLAILHRALPHGVFLDSNPAPAFFDSVEPNLAQTIRSALGLLRHAGVGPVGFIGGEGPIVDGRRRLDVREATFRELTRHPELIVSRGPFNVENGRYLGEAVLRRFGDRLPGGFIVASDTLAVGILQSFTAAGVLVPRDLALVSINDSDVAKYVSTPLTTYRIDQRAMSTLALQLIQGALTGPVRPHIHALVDTELVVRESFVPGAEGR